MRALVMTCLLAFITSIQAQANQTEADQPKGEQAQASTTAERPRQVLSFSLKPGQDMVGEERVIQAKASDTFADLAERYAVGYRELGIANQRVDPWLPGDGTHVVIPQWFILPNAPKKGIVLNTAEMRLYYYKDAHHVLTFPVSVGRGAWQTPMGITHVASKVRDPAWYPPASVRAEYKKDDRSLPRVVPAGPDNPLGQYAMKLAIPGYLLHGTNHPFAIGMQVTHGCIRLHPKDIKTLFSDVPRGEEVNIVYQPFKAGWQGDVLYIEAHPPLDAHADKPQDLSKLVNAVVQVTDGPKSYWINWDRALFLARHPDGIPHPVGRRMAPPSQVTQR